ncbi:MAG TPA: SDR family oxidoreductase [Blastocatellia bacterium]|nr:SDR family oxidoreductase [Blastocatellia bacterium]
MKLNQDTVAVITGAASGIGRALALRLAQTGASLAIADLNQAGLEETARQISGVKVSTHLVDVSDSERVAAFAQEVVRHHGRASLLINNAGVALLGTFEELALHDIEWLMGINFWGVVYGVKHFLPILREQPEAHIVNLSSVFGLISIPGQSAYCASKFAVRGLTEALHHELLNSRVRVSSVHPGGIKTNIARNARPGTGADPARKGTAIADFDKLTPTTPEKAAERIVRGILRNEPRILIGSDAAAIDRTQRLMPQSYWKLMTKLFEFTLRRKFEG